MVFDVDNRDSFTSLIQWENEMKKNGIEKGRVKVIVCGNKCDGKGREVNTAEAQKWAKNRNYPYFETSANTGVKVNEAFEALFEQCIEQYQEDKKKFGII